MPTIQQLVRTGRTQITKNKSVALDSCPQRGGFVRVFTLHTKNQTLQCVK
jgi:small subunit ribosomal protein S12